MPHVTDDPPTEIARDLDALVETLDAELPPRTLDRNLLVATWNIRGFGGLTEKWASSGDDSPKRDLQSVRVIAEVIRRFDVVALQEVKGNLKALRHTLKVLGSDWGLVLTDVTRGDAGNDERLGYLFDRRKVQMSGLAGELVVPDEEFEEIRPGALERQFARTPYAVSFRCGDETFILVTLHVLYGDNAAARTPELRAIAEWLDEWARDVNAWGHNLVALGDFNIDRKDDERYEAFTSTGLEVPSHLHDVPRTIFGDGPDKFYDQIAWFTKGRGRPALSLTYRDSGHFDFRDVALPRRDLSNRSLSWHISDHYPLWAEFEL
ncbi:endonuclease/exonuclease/phosphatase family protein [Halogeometricum limi]|uniref:Endonuclease/Exonuclease/phosphatase family protein n=1 Tax=Halogeometricum limi TaxID=555875 RepID=A0A1I6I9M2_9EURY|nr:endonuclease/exonuclease/phosphatase family protein [Halogeometricum limi]SFR63465.1 Endonuclease/Exonuclease/phosphatase family protein [Halogeometricum limi]